MLLTNRTRSNSGSICVRWRNGSPRYCPFGWASRRRLCGGRIVANVSRVGVTGADGCAAGRNVAVDGSRFSSHPFVSSAREPGGRSAGGCCRPARLSDAGMRFDFSCGRKTTGSSACLAYCIALARCAVVRAFFADGATGFPGRQCG